ncbi:MAG: methyltransferase domain-containing protein [Longimicrobiales bacterium]|nr:methyltransferase domain-containing protein [Longimicrobiales bacterium]
MPAPSVDPLPDFTRVSWADEKLASTWAPRVAAVSEMVQELQWLSVVEGVRSSALLKQVSASSWPEVRGRARKLGLIAMPLSVSGVAGSYSTTAVPLEEGRPVGLEVALFKAPSLARLWMDYAGNSDREGKLLGYPQCCRRFFEETWGTYLDTTWQMAERGGTVDGRTATVEGSLASVMLRWVGVRLVQHLPCSFSCDYSKRIAEDMLRLARDRFPGAARHAEEMLEWDTEWSALHGIAIIRTPAFRVAARTGWTAERWTVRKRGSRPSGGAVGVPFKGSQGASEGHSRVVSIGQGGEKASCGQPGPPGGTSGATRECVLNGFSTPEAMREAHRDVLRALEGVDEGLRGPVVDLGCGTGVLATRAAERLGGASVAGCDTNPHAIYHAREKPGRWEVRDLFEFSSLPPSGLVIFMPGRVVERGVESEAVAALRGRLRGRILLVYCYGDWRRSGGLTRLCNQAFGGSGWRILAGPHSGEAAESALIRLEGPP